MSTTHFIPRPPTKHKNIIAIDPDLIKSGVAVFNQELKDWVFARTISIENIVAELKQFKPSDTIIFVECGWLNKKSNFRQTVNRRVSDNISMKVGQNHATGKIIIALLEAAGYTVEKFRPLVKGIFKTTKGWTKVGKEYIAKQSGLSRRLSDEECDAIFAVLHFK